MHAIELLLDDHDQVAVLFDRVRAEDDGLSLFKKIKAMLEAHKYVEETLFYPRLLDEGDDELKSAVGTAIENHRSIKESLDELAETAGDAERFGPALKVVMEDVEQYADDEEERLFPLVEDQFDEELLEQLGQEMEEEKARFQAGATV
jgi:hemerythrin superfamily protein